MVWRARGGTSGISSWIAEGEATPPTGVDLAITPEETGEVAGL
jgi:hypothetical protein